MAADATSKGFWRLSLGARIFVATALLVALAVGTAVVVTFVLGNRIAWRAAERALGRSSSIQASFEERRLAQLQLIARLFLSDPNFTGYLVEAIDADDSYSIVDLLEERQGDLGFDFAIVLDPQGWVLARTDLAEHGQEDLSRDPLVTTALDGLMAYGAWLKDGRLYHAATVPLVAGGLLQGFLIAGYVIDDPVALELRRIAETEVAFVAASSEGPVLAATTLEPRLARQLGETLQGWQGLFDGEGAEATQPRELTMGRRRWLALVRPLAGASDERVGAAVSLTSLEEQLQPYRQIETVLVVVGLAAILLASLVSYLLPKRVLRPVRQLAMAAKAAAEGDYDQEIVTRRSDEVGQLSQAFMTLLSELREKRDMEVYLGELTRNLPEPAAGGGAGGQLTTARSSTVALLGVEIRGRSRGREESRSAEDTLDRLARDLGLISAAVSAHGGTVRAVLGYRAVASFEGARLASQALSAAVAIQSAWRSAGQETSRDLPALVLVVGDAVSGSVVWGENPQDTLAGASMEELEHLLRVAKPGDLLVARSAYQPVGEVLRQTGMVLDEQAGFSQTLPVFAVDRALASHIGESDLAVTWDSRTVKTRTFSTLSGIGPGTRLGDRFEILSVLGAGGMGVVYKANDRKLDELVALKMLKEGWGDAEALERLKSELKLARKISHTNVLRTFDFGEVNGIPFITMEYVRGITLRQLLDQSGPLPLSAGLRLARQLCRGLEVAHSQGVLHRDIKPENLILEPTGNAKLMDFGIARPLHRAGGPTEKGVLIGTPYYLAPEQIQGTEIDARADLYACGVVFYEVFTGELPFSTEGNIMQLLMRRTREDPVAPSTHWPAIPEALERIILKCLERERKKRWSDVKTLLQELETLRA